MTALATVRRIEPRDESALADVLRAVMAAHGALGAADPEIGAMGAAYGGPRSRYFVAERGGDVLGGAGIAPLADGPGDTCELRKMYLAEGARGHGIGRLLLEACLDAARELGYRRCYLETMATMARARALYEAAGFARLAGSLRATPGSRCNTYYVRELSRSERPEK